MERIVAYPLTLWERSARDLPDGSSPLILVERTRGQINYPILISIRHIVTSSKILAERINHLALMFGALSLYSDTR